jgi:hypothetical protein
MTTDLATMPEKGLQKRSSDVLDFVQHMDKLWDLATILVKSRMLPSSISTPEAAVAIILKGKELGIGPMAAFAGITVIQGKPVVSPQLMLSLINRSGLMQDMKIEDDGETCRVTMKRAGRAQHTSAFSMEDAKAMQLATKDNWKKMGAIMRQWRAVAANARVTFPDVIDGMYTPEEMGAAVDEDGAIIEGEVVEEYRPAPEAKAIPQNHSGHGKGMYASPEQVIEFNAWVSDQCQKINRKWAEEWDAKAEGWMAEGHRVPEKIDEVINPWQAKGHLLKWAIDTDRLDPSIVPEESKTRQADGFVAIVYHRTNDDGMLLDRRALKAEFTDYLKKRRQVQSDKVYRKHPELAPAGWAEEQAEGHGDAYDGPVQAEEVTA